MEKQTKKKEKAGESGPGGAGDAPRTAFARLCLYRSDPGFLAAVCLKIH